MKKLITLAAILVTSVVSAEFCTSGMVARNGNILDTFSGYGYDKREACRSALRECSIEKSRRSYERRVQNSTCENLDNRRNERRSCTFEMVTRRGRVVDTFTERQDRYNSACENARETCETERRFRGRSGATCQKVRGSGRNTRMVTRSCTVERVGRTRNGRTRVFQTHIGRATGPKGSGVKGQACANAAQECRMESRRSPRGSAQSCVKRDSNVSNSGSNYDVFGL